MALGLGGMSVVKVEVLDGELCAVRNAHMLLTRVKRAGAVVRFKTHWILRFTLVAAGLGAQHLGKHACEGE